MRDDVEPSEVAALLASLVDEQEPGDDDMAEFSYLRSRRALLDAASEAVTARMAAVVARIYGDGTGTSYARVAEQLDGVVTRARVQQWVEAARRRAA
jgi:hypothetical protein